MIKNKEDLKRVLAIENKIYGGGIKYLIPVCFSEHQILMKYFVVLRKLEYYTNSGNRLMKSCYTLLLRRLQIKTGIMIPPNTCGEGLSIGHLGSIIINERAKIGNNCRIHAGALIGANAGGVPQIGNNVYIGPGAKIFGDILIADGVRIGANAVVNKSCIIENATLVGVPAHINQKNEGNEYITKQT